MKKEANFFFRRNYAMAVTNQYHQNTMHESAMKGILLGYMATGPVKKIKQVMAMILGRIMAL